jgi:hypothetical protein
MKTLSIVFLVLYIVPLGLVAFNGFQLYTAERHSPAGGMPNIILLQTAGRFFIYTLFFICSVVLYAKEKFSLSAVMSMTIVISNILFFVLNIAGNLLLNNLVNGH